MSKVDSAFIPEVAYKPNTCVTQEAQGIPLIDLSSHDIDAIIDEIGHACREWGFFQIINHGVPLERLQRLEEAVKKFFHLNLEEKRKVRRDAHHVMGYYDTEFTKNVRDWKEVFDYTVNEPTLAAASVDENDKRVAHWENQWPLNPPEFRYFIIL